MTALGGGLFVADTSAFARSAHPDARDEWAEALRDGRILICPPVELELLYAARDLATVEQTARALASLRRVPLTDGCARSASAAMRELALHGSAGFHRVPPIDCLVAACAQAAGLPPAKCEVYKVHLGGGFGRRGQQDYVTLSL